VGRLRPCSRPSGRPWSFYISLLNVSGVDQTGNKPVPFQYVVERNRVDAGRFHGHGCNAITHQSFGHLLPIRRHRHEDSPAPISSPAAFGSRNHPKSCLSCARCVSCLPGFALPGFACGFFWLAIASPFLLMQRPGCTNESTLLNGISPRAGQTVTTVWRTEPGTTLINAFNSTTVLSAYFRTCALNRVHRNAAPARLPSCTAPPKRVPCGV
jgi:hypothetical protein